MAFSCGLAGQTDGLGEDRYWAEALRMETCTSCTTLGEDEMAG